MCAKWPVRYTTAVASVTKELPLDWGIVIRTYRLIKPDIQRDKTGQRQADH